MATLQKLNASGNHMSAFGAAQLLYGCASSADQLREVDLSDAIHSTDGLEYFGSAAGKLCRLQHCDISGCKLSDRERDYLAARVKCLADLKVRAHATGG